ncbi:MAG: DNA mismatch repair endonuclease MutL [Dehalococcoidia bacterium]|nr:DNA mismatch repair endonuclease MutL [Dehalococcoidia bacterium]
MPIRTLAPEVVCRIAAGEVVERPASVVKELVENSLDAGATQIILEVVGAGTQSIRVVDNGSGISPAEVELAFQRHATSKIACEADIESIRTLGFRGEALASIAAVSQVDLISRPAAEIAGSFIRVSNGRVVEKRSRGCSPGTAVTVRRLFANVPARLKFLRSPATENSRMANLVSQYALAFPEVRFNMVIDGHLNLRTPGSGNLKDVVAELYGLDIANAMLDLGQEPHKGESISVTGYIGTAGVARASRGYMSFFVNRRWVQSRMLSYAVEEAYRGFLMGDRYPVAVVNLWLTSDEVDVNVHPAKTEVRFRNDRAIFGAVQKAVRTLLVGQAPIPEFRPASSAPTLSLRAEPTKIGFQQAPSSAPIPLAMDLQTPKLPILRVLGQVGNSYVVAEAPDGMYLIDQHAAHERIQLEKLERQRQAQGIETQGLLEPLTVELTPQQEESMRTLGPVLADYGFKLEPFGPRSYLLRSIPAVLKGESATEMLREMLNGSGGKSLEDLKREIVVSLACHSAVKAGQALSPPEMSELVRQLEITALPRTCPHGRPTMIHLSSRELEKEFGRR